MSNVDLHALFASRAIAKARSFLRQGPSGGSSSNVTGVGSLSKSPNGQGGFGGGAMVTAAINAEVNRRDHLGRTVLHLAASELADWASEWVEALLGVPGLQVNAVDAESGWSALHRALYAGNVAAARLVLSRDDVDARLKDHEGLSPFDVYNSTVDGTNPSKSSNASNPGRCELHTWGSNRNFVLGFSSDGDRTYPERVQLKREEGGTGLSAFEPLRVKDVSMARLHTAIVTDEARNNIRMCGYGTGGRLGQSAHTQFNLTPLHDFPHQVASVVVSPDHTVVVTTSGAVWTFGLNRFGQLGYALDSPSPSSAATGGASTRAGGAPSDEPIQSVPRRVVGALKKEVVIGAAASRTHSAVFTADGALYTWGTNKGQLGYPASGTPVQVLPRKVTSVSQPIAMLTATENATACLLDESKEVVVLYHEGYVRIAFPVTPFPSRMQPYRPPNVGDKPTIRKIASCGNTFAALSTLGDVFTWTLEGTSSTSGSETPNSLARLAPKPQRIWSLRRAFTAVTDLGVGLDGTIILCTVSGHCFIRTKKYDAHAAKSGTSTPTGLSSSSRSGSSGWKFSRVPFLQRCIRVAANSTGGFAALRSDVPLRFIDIEGPTLAENLLGLLPHWLRIGPLGAKVGSQHKRVGVEDGDDADADADTQIVRDVEVASRFLNVLAKWETRWETHRAGSDMFVLAGNKRFPVHRAILAARSSCLAQRLDELPSTADELALECSEFTALLLLHYLYSDDFPAVWDLRIGLPVQAMSKAVPGVGAVRQELQTLASDLRLSALADALGYQTKMLPTPTLAHDIMALLQRSLDPKSSSLTLVAPDIVLILADREVECHSIVLRARCTFFETFYNEGEWTVLRKQSNDGKVRFDLQHIEWNVMSLVLEHIYRDAGMSLFQSVNRATADEYIDFTTQVLAVANELLLDKLKAVCSAVLRSFVTLHNVCSILSDAAFYESIDLVRACMYYLASSMETALENRLLDDLPPELLKALTSFVQERQGAKMPITRSGLLVQDLMTKHAAWVADLDIGRPTGGSRRWRPAIGHSTSPRPSPSMLSPGPSPSLGPRLSPRVRPQNLPTPSTSPMLPAQRDADDMFMMDEEFSLDSGTPSRPTFTPKTSSPALGSNRRRSSNTVVGMAGSPSTTSFTPLGSPPPSRLQPWSKAVPSQNKPMDLRSIMSAEASTTTPPAPRPRASTPQSGMPASPSPGTSAGSWRPVISSSRASLAEIQSQQSVRSSPQLPSSRPLDATRPVTRHASSTPPTSIPISRPVVTARVDPASAVGAPVYTPTRLPSGSKPTTRGGFGAADVPWTNYTLAAPSPPANIASSSSPDPFGASPAAASSFAAIQMQQRREVEQIREGRAVRSLTEVMEQERAQARQRELELKQERDFAKWFEEESSRVQRELGVGGSAPTTNGSGRGGRGGGGGGGAPRRGGKSGRGAGKKSAGGSGGSGEGEPQGQGRSENGANRGRGRGGGGKAADGVTAS